MDDTTQKLIASIATLMVELDAAIMLEATGSARNSLTDAMLALTSAEDALQQAAYHQVIAAAA